jgi:hypothetical protein
MTVDEDSECPFCQETLTYEPSIPESSEHIVFNKYYWIYKLKTMWFSLACLVFCVVRLILAEKFWYPNMFLFGLACFVVSLAQRPLILFLRDSLLVEEKAYAAVETAKYILGVLCVLVALFTH